MHPAHVLSNDVIAEVSSAGKDVSPEQACQHLSIVVIPIGRTIGGKGVGGEPYTTCGEPVPRLLQLSHVANNRVAFAILINGKVVRLLQVDQV